MFQKLKLIQIKTHTYLFQSHHLNSTQVTETLCYLLQRKTSQDQGCTCTGKHQLCHDNSYSIMPLCSVTRHHNQQ